MCPLKYKGLSTEYRCGIKMLLNAFWAQQYFRQFVAHIATVQNIFFKFFRSVATIAQAVLCHCCVIEQALHSGVSESYG